MSYWLNWRLIRKGGSNLSGKVRALSGRGAKRRKGGPLQNVAQAESLPQPGYSNSCGARVRSERSSSASSSGCRRIKTPLSVSLRCESHRAYSARTSAGRALGFRSQARTKFGSLAVMRRLRGVMHPHRIEPVCLRSGVTGSLVAASQARAKLSSDRLKMNRPSAFHRAARAGARPMDMGECNISPAAASQIFTQDASPALASRVPSGLHSTSSTPPPCFAQSAAIPSARRL